MSLRVESDYKARLDVQVQTNIKNLIFAMTDFDEEDENFGIAQEYINSNLKNHRFLSVDKFRVKRELKGLEEKFDIHLQQSKAETLRKLVDKFMSRKLKPHVPDIHFSILQFLLLMSNNPISLQMDDEQFGQKYLTNDDRSNITPKNQFDSNKMIDERFSFNNNINFIMQEQQLQLKKYDDDYVFESSSEEGDFDDEEEEEEEIEEKSNKKINEANQDQSNIYRKAIDVFNQDNSSKKKEGIIKNKLNQNNITTFGDKSIDQSKIVSFKNMNDNKMGHQKDSLLSITSPHQNQQEDHTKNQNSVLLGATHTNQSFWNMTQQSILKKSSLQRRSYEEFIGEQKNEEERQLFLSTRQFTKNDLFKDPNSLSQVYENYIKETINRDTNLRDSQYSQVKLNHWIYQNKTERQIIQDIILMLQSQPSSTFILVGDIPPEFKLTKKVQVNHLTPSTLENMVDSCIDFANQLLKFQFYREQYSKIEIGTSFQAFLASIQAFYLQFQKYINAFHLVFLHQSAQIQKKEIEVTLEERYEFMLKKTISLMELFRGLREYQMEMKMMMNMLEGVIEIYKKSNLNSMEIMNGNSSNTHNIQNNNNQDDQDNASGYIACQIIDFLYYQLQIDSSYYCKLSDLQQLNSQLFLLSIEPYLAILNDWLHGGFFFDKFSEFFIKNNTRNQNQQQAQQKYQHIDHQINWVKDFSIRYHQEPDSISKSVTPNFIKKYEQIILQIGKNVRLIGYILNEHDQRIIVNDKLKIDDIRNQIKNQISMAIDKIELSQHSNASTADETQKTLQNNSIQSYSVQQENKILGNKSNSQRLPEKEPIQEKLVETQIKNTNQPKKFLKNLSISSILKQKNLPNSSSKGKQTFQLKDEINFDDKSLQQSVIIDENQMQVELENPKIQDNPFNIFTFNHSEIFNQSIFSLQDSFLNKIIPDLQKLNTKMPVRNDKLEQVNLNKKINQLIEQEGFTSQFLRLFDLSIEYTLTQMDKQVKEYLGSILMKDFKLLEHFQALRHIYFMENGHVTTEFLSYLFDNLETYDTLKNASSLKNYFKELISHSNQLCVKNLSEHFSIEIQHDPINTYLKNLKIKFEAPYPLDAIFDQDSIFLYNHIFQFLVQLKKSQHFLLDKKQIVLENFNQHIL